MDNFTNSNVGIATKIDLNNVIIVSFIYVAIMISSILLVSAIYHVKQLRTHSNVLIIHLAVCDMIRATLGIPFQLGTEFAGYFPYGNTGCKIISPFATHCTNAIVITFLCIAIERYKTVSSIKQTLTRPLTIAVIVFIHVLALLTVIPYTVHLHFTSSPSPSCVEQWASHTSRQAYTLSLFLIQYAIPLPIMAVLYALTWCKIRKQNQKMIHMSEEYERKINADSSTLLADDDKQVESRKNNNTEDSNECNYRPRLRSRQNSLYNSLIHSEAILSIRNKVKYLKQKKYFMSETSYLRNKQTIRTFKMFSAVIIVFAIFSLPNQIWWLINDFSHVHSFPPLIVLRILNNLQFTNSLLNCWIYGGFNKTFRKAYKDLFIAFFTCGFRVKKKRFSDCSKYTASVMETQCDSDYTMRRKRFSEMFQEQKKNFEQYRHLYKSAVDTKKNTDLDTNEKAKKRTSIIWKLTGNRRYSTGTNIIPKNNNWRHSLTPKQPQCSPTGTKVEINEQTEIKLAEQKIRTATITSMLDGDSTTYQEVIKDQFVDNANHATETMKLTHSPFSIPNKMRKTSLYDSTGNEDPYENIEESFTSNELRNIKPENCPKTKSRTDNLIGEQPRTSQTFSIKSQISFYQPEIKISRTQDLISFKNSYTNTESAASTRI